MKYYSDIDGIRALAVIAVIVNHLNASWLPSGFLGVDIFFIISGFVVTGSLLNNKALKFSSFISDFYKKRIKRLYPALLFSVVISLFVAVLIIPDPRVSLMTGIKSLYGISNFYLVEIGSNYFAQDASLNMFTHTWSLAVEEQFYFIFPVFVFLTGITFNFERAKKRFFWLSILLWAISFIFFLVCSFKKPDWAFYLMPSRFWQLIMGAVIYTSVNATWVRKISYNWLYVLLAGMVACLVLPEEYKSYTTIVISFLTGMVLVFIKESGKNCYALNNPVSVGVGKISYSLYLWHWPVIVIFRHTLGLGSYFILLVIVIMILATLFSYFAIEKVMRHLSWSKIGVVSFVGVLCSMPIINDALVDNRWRLYLGNKKEAYSLLGSKEMWRFDACGYFAHKKFFSELVKSVDCSVNGKLSNHSVSKKVFSFGNSYLSHLLPAVAILADKNRDYTFSAYTAPGCPLWRGTYVPLDKVCSKVFEDFLRTVESRAKKGDKILLSNSLSFYFVHGNFLDREGKGVPSVDAVMKTVGTDMADITRKFKERGVDVYFVSPVPILNKINPEVCYQPWSYLRRDCDENVDEKELQRLRKYHHQFQNNAGINYINIFDPVYEAISSDPSQIRMYLDQVHLSVYSQFFIMNFLGQGMKLNTAL